MRIAGLAVLICAALSQTAFAKPPATSLRPDARPASANPVPVSLRAAVIPVLGASPLPVPRPVVARQPARVVLATAGAAVRLSQRPGARPDKPPPHNVVQTAVRTQPETVVATSRVGSVCGDRSIRGQKLSPIPGRLRGCGISKPVRITAVDGVTLSQPATLNCNTAKALKRWVNRSVKPTVGRLGGGVASLEVVAHYACRSRNNQPGAKISEHGRGNAIDIAAINLKNGVSLSVLTGWNDRVQSKLLRKIHGEACGTFGTVLGPRADKFHKDHFHLDVANHRSGSYCR